MKKSFAVGICFVTVAGFAQAQLGATQEVPVVNAAPIKTEGVVIVNQTQTTEAAAIQKQPLTVVEASPLSVSRVDEARKVREQMELDTEQKIAEKLERARLEDERRRQDTILGTLAAPGSLDAQKKAEAAPAAAAPVAQPTVVVVPAAPEVKSADTLSRGDVREEVRAELATISEEAKVDKKSNTFMGASVGVLNYNSFDIESFGALGVSGGWITSSNVMVDISFLYSDNTISRDLFLYRNFEQYNLGIGARYAFMNGSTIRPNVGATMNLVYRQYSQLLDPYGITVPSFAGDLSSTAMDWGFVAGVDFVVSPQFTLGVDYRYMTNLSYKYDGDSFLNTPAFRANYGAFAQRPLEERSYDVWSAVLRFTF